MRKFVYLLLILQLSVPASATRRLTVEQLQQVLASAHGKSDAKVSLLLSGLELTERLRADKLVRWQAEMPGPESRRSLVLLADLSAFLHPPPLEIPATATPDIATQRALVAQVVDYATKATRLLPNFLATRDTIRFEDSAASQRPDSSTIPYKPLHAVERFSTTVVYRDGQELESDDTQKIQSRKTNLGLITSGEFGPIMGTVLVDAAHSKLSWSHWEKGAHGPVAVFQFTVPREESHYKVKFCCVLGESAYGVVAQKTGYQGEMAIDPATGAIQRLTLRADLTKADKIVRADILVEYGPVEIGGQTYICPVKSISISIAPSFSAQALELRSGNQNPGLQTKLNDVSFDQYHVFRSEARVLTSDGAPAHESLSGSREDAKTGTPSDPITQPLATTPNSSPSSLPIKAESAAVAPPDSVIPSQSSATMKSEPPLQEFISGDKAEIPDISVAPSNVQEKDFTLRVTTQLVDVGVVAFDKKGRPVTGLKQEDFQILDNGRKQTVQSFSGPCISSNNQSEALAIPTSPPGISYSNRRATMDDAANGDSMADRGVTILLIDTSSLAWADLTRAREQMLKGLESLPSSERVGIYTQGGRGLQVLAEMTTNRAKLLETLRKWMPNAQELARAQQAERLNRQQFDDVQHVGDLQSVNGNLASAPDTASTVDPELRDFAPDADRAAMALLVTVARNLASTPGRKNLVWIASENVLANWTDRAVASDKGTRHPGDAVLRVQEALNDAHVSLYPLDASQIETNAVDPGFINQSIDLSPGTSAPPPPQGGAQKGGRLMAELQQDTHLVQSSIQELAQATGGRVFRRGSDLAEDLNSVVEDGNGHYMLGFAPDTSADDRYHSLKVKVGSHRGVALRYRTGYLYATEPATPKDRFREAVWRPVDVSDIALRARALPAYTGSAFKLNIAINDLALQLQGGRWVDKLDIFVVRRSPDGSHAKITGRSLSLALLPSTYQSLLEDGVPFEQFVEKDNNTDSVRFLVVDENSGRTGSLTIPFASVQAVP
jgi:VWFA-related protein